MKLTVQPHEGLTAVEFDNSGLRCAVGSSNGLVAIFDLRSPRPLTVKDHMYASPIVSLTFKNTDVIGGMCTHHPFSLLHSDFSKDLPPLPAS